MKNLIIFIVAVLFSSCWSETDDTKNECQTNCTSVYGSVISDFDETPVAGLSFQLYREVKSELGGYRRDVKLFETDKNGDFNFDFYINNGEIGKSYAIELISVNSKYIDLGYDTDLAYIMANRRDTTIFVKILLPTKSFVKVKFKDRGTCCVDFISRYGQNNTELWSYYRQRRGIEIERDTVKNEVLYEVAGNQYNSFEYNNIVDSIFVKSSDTLLLEL